MTTNQPCPPIPTLDELTNLDKYIPIDPIDVVLNEFLVMNHLGNIRCIQIVHVFTDYVTRKTSQFTYRENGNGPAIGMRVDRLNNEQGKLYRKSPTKDFYDVIFKLNKDINDKKKNIGTISDAGKRVLGNEDLTRYMIGPFLGPTPRRKGGRRKTRAKKNKRKGTRRIRRKYKR